MPRKRTPDLMHELLTGKAPPRPPESPSEAPERPPEGPSKLAKRKLWLPPEAWEALDRHFRETGTPTSTGLRAWILQRMRDEGIT